MVDFADTLHQRTPCSGIVGAWKINSGWSHSSSMLETPSPAAALLMPSPMDCWRSVFFVLTSKLQGTRNQSPTVWLRYCIGQDRVVHRIHHGDLVLPQQRHITCAVACCAWSCNTVLGAYEVTRTHSIFRVVKWLSSDCCIGSNFCDWYSFPSCRQNWLQVSQIQGQSSVSLKAVVRKWSTMVMGVTVVSTRRRQWHLLTLLYCQSACVLSLSAELIMFRRGQACRRAWRDIHFPDWISGENILSRAVANAVILLPNLVRLVLEGNELSPLNVS